HPKLGDTNMRTANLCSPDFNGSYGGQRRNGYLLFRPSIQLSVNISRGSAHSGVWRPIKRFPSCDKECITSCIRSGTENSRTAVPRSSAGDVLPGTAMTVPTDTGLMDEGPSMYRISSLPRQTGCRPPLLDAFFLTPVPGKGRT